MQVRPAARDFSPRQGAKTREYFVYFKFLQRSIGEKDPPQGVQAIYQTRPREMQIPPKASWESRNVPAIFVLLFGAGFPNYLIQDIYNNIAQLTHLVKAEITCPVF